MEATDVLEFGAFRIDLLTQELKKLGVVSIEPARVGVVQLLETGKRQPERNLVEQALAFSGRQPELAATRSYAVHVGKLPHYRPRT